MKTKIVDDFKKHRIVAIFRGIDKSKALNTAIALWNGGIKFCEVTFDMRDREYNFASTIDSVKNIKGGIENRDLYVGVGTVLTTEQVLMAKEAGADFIITPTVNTNVIKLAKELGMMTMPGGYTPTELQNAWEAGADFVKIFPASDAGADYFHAVSGPLPHIPLVAVGGITLQNMCDFLKKGAVGIGVGGNLVDKRMISECRYDELTKLAHEYVKQLGDEQ